MILLLTLQPNSIKIIFYRLLLLAKNLRSGWLGNREKSEKRSKHSAQKNSHYCMLYFAFLSSKRKISKKPLSIFPRSTSTDPSANQWEYNHIGWRKYENYLA